MSTTTYLRMSDDDTLTHMPPVQTPTTDTRWTWRDAGNLAGWASAFVGILTVAKIAFAITAVGHQAWTAAAVLAGLCLLAVASAAVLAVWKITTAVSSRACREFEDRIRTQLTVQLEQQVWAVRRECREAVKRQGEQVRAEVLPRVVDLEARVEALDEQYERGYVDGVGKATDALAPATGAVVRQIRPTTPWPRLPG